MNKTKAEIEEKVAQKEKVWRSLVEKDDEKVREAIKKNNQLDKEAGRRRLKIFNEEAKKQEMGIDTEGAQKKDPFSRRETRPRMMIMTASKVEEAIKAQKSRKEEEAEKKAKEEEKEKERQAKAEADIIKRAEEQKARDEEAMRAGNRSMDDIKSRLLQRFGLNIDEHMKRDRISERMAERQKVLHVEYPPIGEERDNWRKERGTIAWRDCFDIKT